MHNYFIMNKWCIFIIFLLFPFGGISQIITTYAGGGTSGLGDGGPATNAVLHDPGAGIFDNYGNYYFAEAIGGNRIRVVNSAGIVNTIAGNGTAGYSGDNVLATSTNLNQPCAVRVDTTGNLFICDGGNHRIRKIDAATGIITTIVGTGVGGFGGDSGLATSALLFNPQDIFIDKTGNLYIADGTNQRIRKVNTSGIITTIAGTGVPGSTGDNGPATAARIQFPYGLTMDDTGNIYIAGADHVVRKINNAGIITRVGGVSGMYTFTGDNIPATDAPIDPIRLVIDFWGQLIIADRYNFRVFRVDSNGIIHTIAGTGVAGFSGDGDLATNAELYFPSGVTFDSCRNLYIAEANNGRIRKVSFNPTCAPLKTTEISTHELTIYPNPANDELHLDNLKTTMNYAIINITGIIEQSGTLKKGNNVFNITALPTGLHILELIDDEGKKTVKKIVKE